MRGRYVGQALFWGLCFAGWCAPVRADPGNVSIGQRYILVLAEAEQDFTPDQVKLSVSVETQGITVAEAGSANARKMTSVTSALHRLGVAPDRIRTAEFSVTPKYAASKSSGFDPEEMRKITGYVATNTLEITLNTPEKVASLIDAVTMAGAGKVGNLHFSLQHVAELQDQVFAMAVQNAMRRAGAMAKAAHGSLGPVLQIQDAAAGTENGREMSVITMVQNKELRQPFATQISPGKITLSAKVQLRIALE